MSSAACASCGHDSPHVQQDGECWCGCTVRQVSATQRWSAMPDAAATCPRECSEHHTFEPPCLLATPAVLTAQPIGTASVAPRYEPAQDYDDTYHVTEIDGGRTVAVCPTWEDCCRVSAALNVLNSMVASDA